MNLSPAWVSYFSDAGIESVHWSKLGNHYASDKEIFRWAKENGFIVFTHDLDFGAILASTQAMGPSVIQVRTQDTMPEKLAGKLIEIIKKQKEILDKGALITIDEVKAKIRILPI